MHETQTPTGLMDAPPARERAQRTWHSARAIARTLIAQGEVPTAAIRKILDAEYEGYDGGWEAGDAHEACELAITEILFSLSRVMNQHAKSPQELDAMISKTASVEPRLRGTSQRHDRLQHHATPLEVAWAMAVAADIRPGDRVLDPGAGTGILLGMARMAEPEAKLRGNEADARRAEMLRMAAPNVPVACVDALEPAPQYPKDWGKHEVVLLNPPFSARLGSQGRHINEGLRHAAAAQAATYKHGRIIALLGGSIKPRDKAWEKIIGGKLRLNWCCRIDAKLMRNRNGNANTLICILENTEEDDTFDVENDLECHDNIATLINAVR